MPPHIESLLSARLFLSPQLWNDRIYFVSNLSGKFSLYAMDYGGSVPQPLLPPDITLQNPELIDGTQFWVYPELGKILVNIDKDGDEVYRPMFIPIDGGFPEPAFPQLIDVRVFMEPARWGSTTLHLMAMSLSRSLITLYTADAASGSLEPITEDKWGSFPYATNDAETLLLLGTGYTTGDTVLRLYDTRARKWSRVYGTLLEERAPGEKPQLTGFRSAEFVDGDRGALVVSALLDDTFGLGYLDLSKTDEVAPVEVKGLRHTGLGELQELKSTRDDRYILQYNIDGASWVYEGHFDTQARTLTVDAVLCGEGELSNGVMKSIHYDKASDRFVLEFSTANSPTQIYSIEGEDRGTVRRHTDERILGTPASQLSPGEDASFTSHDGLRVSARLYMPSTELGFEGPRPLVYYVHGGPQGQERPNFAWFSMPLIQFLTLNGFAVFVPNARGSEGYGISYTKRVDHDWGGQDRLDHVYAMTEVLPKDQRIDMKRAGVIGRSYGGYMTLTLALRHPELWKAAVDMFGPYDLIKSFLERIPETWKPYFYEALGHPERDKDFLIERSPKTYMQNLSAPMLVIQGANDPRVVEAESRDVVESLKAAGKDVEYLVFENEGHDVIKYENKVRCYLAITDFFKKHLQP